MYPKRCVNHTTEQDVGDVTVRVVAHSEIAGSANRAGATALTGVIGSYELPAPAAPARATIPLIFSLSTRIVYRSQRAGSGYR